VYRKDISVLHETKASSLVILDSLENIRWEHEILEQRYQRLIVERDELFARFTVAIHEVKQKASFKTLVHEHKLSAAAAEVERESLTLNEVLRAANLDPAAVGALESQLSDVLAEKDSMIAELRAERDAVAARHDQTLRFYQTKLVEQGVRVEELGFAPALSKQILASVQ